MKLVTHDFLVPPALAQTENVHTYSRHVEAHVTIRQVASARVIDACISEFPYAIARESDDDPDLWTSHLLAQQEPGGAGSVSWPFQRISETTPDGDPRGGTWHLMDVARAQHLRLGPQLVSWTAYNETSAAIDGTIPSRLTTSPSFRRIFDATSTGYNPNEPGWSASTGAYARNYADNHPYWAKRNGTIPALISVRARGNNGGSNVEGVVRVYSSQHHYCDVPIDALDAWGWFHHYAHIRVGRGPGDPTNVQAFFRRVELAGEFHVSNFVIHHSGRYDPLT